MRSIKGFSYDPEKDKAVINHINKQQNGSKYIWDLVRHDMEKTNIDEIVKKHVEKYLQGYELHAGKENKFVEIDTNDIKDIFNL